MSLFVRMGTFLGVVEIGVLRCFSHQGLRVQVTGGSRSVAEKICTFLVVKRGSKPSELLVTWSCTFKYRSQNGVPSPRSRCLSEHLKRKQTLL